MALNSPFATIFVALQQQIKNNVSEIRYIDQDIGQLKSDRPPVAWPFLLIDFETFQCSDLAEKVQVVEGTIVMRLGFMPYSNSNQATPTDSQEKALSFYDIEWHLHKVLQGWSCGDGFGTLSRISTQTQKRSDTIRIREIRYNIAFEDYSCKGATQWVPAALVVNEEIGL